MSYVKGDLRLVHLLAIKLLKIRYKNSVMGYVWTLANPLIYVLIFSFIFGQIVSDIDNYPVFALSGMLFWLFFSTTITQTISCLIENARIIKAIAIPPVYYPIATIEAGLINLSMSLLPFVILMFTLGHSFSFYNFLIFPILILLGLFALSLGLILSALNVYFRDVSFLWGALMPALFYATPVAYPASFVPERFLWIIKLNPMFHFMEAIRASLYYGQLPTLESTLHMVAWSIALLPISLWVYNSLKRGFVSNL